MARLLRNVAIAVGIVMLSLAIGTAGYHFLAGLSWIDALLNSSMILTGMGPVNVLNTPLAKLFAAAYALFSGVVFLTMVAVLFAPLLHHFLHRFHLEFEEGSDTN
jgi:ABC-type glycerol-3-phosphate transport system permease component